ncbi:hypothetical protein [Tuwongella immobilis]|uniref:Uncharacterized protein n=1 Tax=Tuwongella immobilis TaxID=692036 RepID=A0A6C2YVC4_9BACT|nr:hypothetical protein [Tuwongella immobilis]VIP04822.1 unnamed protein product [Tuwongella immobilis]VTS07004.1 unnamed protein product [Tuwongella immobilis]
MMPLPYDASAVAQLKQEWTDKAVQVRPGRAEYARFAGRTGRVVTLNCNGKAIVDFSDGAWYDLPLDALLPADDQAATPYDPSVNSAQPLPSRQG